MEDKDKVTEIGRHKLASYEPVHVHDAYKLKKAKENILSLSNQLERKHGKFRATMSGKPTLVYGEGHNMKEHGEGEPYDEKGYLEKSNQDRRNNPKEYDE